MPDTRRALIGDTAIALIADGGLRGLTHRGVDRAAGLPTGSTSYYARTRLALLELAITRMVELDQGDLGPVPRDVEAAATAIAALLYEALTEGRMRTLARYELALEASRRPELRAVYDRGGRRLRERAAAVLAQLGSAEPERHVRVLVAWCEGLLLDAVVGAGGPPPRDELTSDVRDLLNTLLGVRASGDG